MKTYEEIENNPYHVRLLATDGIREVEYLKDKWYLFIMFSNKEVLVFVRVPEHIYKGLIDSEKPSEYYKQYICPGYKNKENNGSGYLYISDH